MLCNEETYKSELDVRFLSEKKQPKKKDLLENFQHPFLCGFSEENCQGIGIVLSVRCCEKKCQSFNFVVKEIDLGKNPKKRIILCCRDPGNVTDPRIIRIPPEIWISVNEFPLLQKHAFGDFYDITECCKVGVNTFRITVPESKEFIGYSFIAQCMQMRDIDEIIQSTRRMEVSRCLDLIKESFLVDLNSEISSMCSILSLMDKCTKKRIQIPSRGEKCSHITCFDLKSWLEKNRSSLSMECDICYQKISLSEIIIDSYFQEILEQTGATVREVSITMDGTWKSVIDSGTSDITSRPKREKGKKKNQLDPSRRECCEQWTEEVGKLVKANVIKITQNGTFHCLLCDTGGMTITTLMGSHVLGKKHLIFQRNRSGLSNSLEDKREVQNCRRKKLNSSSPELCPQPKKKRFCKKFNPAEAKNRVLSYVVPVLKKSDIKPIDFGRKRTEEVCTEQEPKKPFEFKADDDIMELCKTSDMTKCMNGTSKFLWASPSDQNDNPVEISLPSFLSEDCWGSGSNQSWVAQLEAQEKHLPD